jgi:hypothetical protein
MSVSGGRPSATIPQIPHIARIIAVVRSRVVREPLSSRLLFPLTERRFTYREYARVLDRLSSREIVPLRDFARGRGNLGLRHDVDLRLDSALVLGALEHERGIRATYFVLHTAPYWDRPDVVDRLRELQELGHEIGFHNDLVTAQRVHGQDPRRILSAALERLRAGGLDVVGAAAHGSPWCHRLGFHNNYVFEGWDEPLPGFPSTDVPDKLDPREFGLEYEAYHVAADRHLSDSSFDSRRRRWHPAELVGESPNPAECVVVLVHPCHWDRGVAAKTARLGRKLLRR